MNAGSKRTLAGVLSWLGELGRRHRRRGALGRFVAYGLLGWCLEVAFTGVKSAVLARDRTLAGKTYLWMLPIYGLGGLGLEEVHRQLRAHRVGWPLRALSYLALIYGTEYGSGYLLRRLVGQCPWDYSGHGLNVHGLIRLDYAPAWLLCGVGLERIAWVAAG